MKNSLSISPAATARRFPLLSLPSSWSPTLVWMAVAALFLMVALATLPRTAWATGGLPAAPVAQAAEQAAPAATQARARTRCTRCGVVELIRELEPVGQEPAAYEFTVRLRDGTASVSTVVASTANAWTVGDSIILVGGL